MHWQQIGINVDDRFVVVSNLSVRQALEDTALLKMRAYIVAQLGRQRVDSGSCWLKAGLHLSQNPHI